MQHFFEYIDTLNSPYEAFLCDASVMDFPIRPHWHYFMEMIYILEGTSRVECNGENYIVEAGNIIIFHPESVHAIYAASDGPLKYEVIKFDVNKLYTENSYAPKLRIILESAAKSERADIFFQGEQLKGLGVKEIFEECRRELEQRNYGYDIIVHNRICFLLVHLIRLWRENGFDTDGAVSHPLEINSIRAITAYIDEHANEQIKVEDLADMCNMSYSCFAKNFKRYYGRSCKEYIEFIRVCKASDLLLFTDFDLNYISQETGFSDSSHFIKIFKKWKGVTPKQFKKNYRE
ncbi:AraC family transcriptional regulator [Parablautia muri]|uniref:AraC family transcriptional regulator n=1 Tax=Parablautia muri TaxID=2320879 RepID=A0A9X5BHT3_9FIRM|nr:AraC family transcriptional regulator [Parablautia muri]NBJ94205.1 AraC family transcriptional regulator [Parablautia muri]